MEYYAVRTTYHFDQIVEAESSEQAMIKAEDTQPDIRMMEDMGVIEVDRTADPEPIKTLHGEPQPA